MANFVILTLGFVAGIVLRASGRLDARAPAALNAVIIMICLPAIALHYLHGAGLGREAVFPVLMPWLFCALAFALFGAFARLRGWPRARLGALLLTAGFGNTSFVGFPLIEAVYGSAALGVAVLVDQAGSFLALSTFGLLAASLCAESASAGGGAGANSRRAPTFAPALRRVLLFPPFLGLVAGLALRPFTFPPALDEALVKLGSPLGLLAMLSVGAQLRFDREALRSRRGALALGLLFKLVLGPAAMLGIALAVGIHAPGTRVVLLEAAMAPMITGAILSEEFGLDAELANLLVAIGIPLSLISVPIWAFALRAFGVVH